MTWRELVQCDQWLRDERIKAEDLSDALVKSLDESLDPSPFKNMARKARAIDHLITILENTEVMLC